MTEDNAKVRTNRLAEAGVVCAVILVLLLLGPSAPIYHVRGFVCVHTGSRRGYREWGWGGKTRHWERQSKLEVFMREDHPDELSQKWVSYQGTGINYLGQGISAGHGSPGPIISIGADVLDEYVDALTDSAKKAFYDLLASGDREAISEKVSEIEHWRATGSERH